MDVRKTYPIMGLLSAALFVILWIASAVSEPSWHLGELSLSNLGVCGNPTAEMLFNLSCALSGLFGILFGYGVSTRLGLSRICGLGVMVSCIFLTCVGVLTLNYRDAHETVAMSYGVAISITMAISAVMDYKEGRKGLGIFTAVLLLISAAMLFTQSFEVFEPISVICAVIWLVIQSIKYQTLEMSDSRVL